jgi:superfamily I DNA/RNA helicase
LTHIQIALFKFLCSNSDGFCFGGDTAQTIASGVGFRFQDLRALFYDRFIEKDKTKHIPPISFLTQNYRSHSGILQLGNSVLELLFDRFPESVDKIPGFDMF